MVFEWQEVFRQFKEYETDHNGEIEFKKVDNEAVKKLLTEHDFSENRIDSGLLKLEKIEEGKKQKGLGEFF